MSLKSTFLAFKKVVQVVQIRGRRVIWTKYNRRATFFCDTFFNGSIAPFNPLEHFGLFSFCRRIILLQTFSENNFYFATTSCQYNGPKSTHLLFLSSSRHFKQKYKHPKNCECFTVSLFDCQCCDFKPSSRHCQRHTKSLSWFCHCGF